MADTRTFHIPLGSGYLFHTEFTGTVPADSVIESEANRLGYIEGGAELEYGVESTQFKDDFGIVIRNKITAETATLSCSLIAWDRKDLEVFAPTARITEATGKRTIKIGGLENDKGKVHLFRFVHKDSEMGDLRITVVGTQSEGFTLSYKKDEAGAIALKVAAQASDNEGTLILMSEDIKGA